MTDYAIVTGYQPGCIGRITQLHAEYYKRHAGFGVYFESKVARELGAFCDSFDPVRDGLWLVQAEGEYHGSIAIDGRHAADQGAHLRWFILSDALRGQGFGKRLIAAALAFCRQCTYPRVYLWTFQGLAAAAHLYRAAGFQLVEEFAGLQWGREVIEQRYECDWR